MPKRTLRLAIALPLSLTTLWAVDAAANTRHFCAIFDSTAPGLSNVKCWGVNVNGALGLGDTATRGDDLNEMGDNLPFVDLNGSTITAIAGMRYGQCALLDTGDVKCWGENNVGDLGLGDREFRGDEPNEMGANLPTVDLGSVGAVTQLSPGQRHMCALFDNGRIKCWGNNGDGNLGQGDSQHRGDNANEMGDNLPYVDLGTENGQPLLASQVASGGEYACALLTNGRVKCWGDNNQGQLGLGDLADRGDDANEMGDNLPYVDLGTNDQGAPLTVVQLNAYGAHTCAVFDDNRLKCWGLNDRGRLGLGNTQENQGDDPNEMGDNLPFVNLGSNRTVQALSVRGSGTCVLLDNGGVKCWGYNGNGNLGIGNQSDRGYNNDMGNFLPEVNLGDGVNVAGLMSNTFASCVLTDDGRVKCWGDLPHDIKVGDRATDMGNNLPYTNLGTGLTVVSMTSMVFPLCEDPDNDGICADVDNCPAVANADQADSDNDGVGDVCDACPADSTNDSDGDGVCQDVDNCPTVSNANQADDNGDGYGDACVSPLANIPETATLGSNLIIGPDASIGTYASIGDGATVNGSVGNSTVIGAGSVVPAGVTVGNSVRMGA
ncbi:MAG: thrombospondin type 3 repeat-containing protein, partial [Bradymonadia bacterium]